MNWTNNIDLKLDSVTINDTGLYTCEAVYQEKTYYYDIDVSVRGKFKYIAKFDLPLDLF